MLPAETNRQFTATQPNQLWVAEITFATTWVDFVYVAFVIDVFFARRIVGWRVASTMRTPHGGQASNPGVSPSPSNWARALPHGK
jgi:transposase InsO family protein